MLQTSSAMSRGTSWWSNFMMNYSLAGEPLEVAPRVTLHSHWLRRCVCVCFVGSLCFVAMALPALLLYLVLHKDHAELAFRVEQISTRNGSPSWPHFGLRPVPEQALDRNKKMFGTVDHFSLALCEIRFSAAGIAKWVTELSDKTYDFQPRLYKKAWRNQDKDWGVWHFLGDLPLKDKDLVTCVVRPVD